jgi:hypothetical protein
MPFLFANKELEEPVDPKGTDEKPVEKVLGHLRLAG